MKTRTALESRDSLVVLEQVERCRVLGVIVVDQDSVRELVVGVAEQNKIMSAKELKIFISEFRFRITLINYTFSNVSRTLDTHNHKCIYLRGNHTSLLVNSDLK